MSGEEACCSSELSKEEENRESEAEGKFVDGIDVIPAVEEDKFCAVRARGVAGEGDG